MRFLAPFAALIASVAAVDNFAQLFDRMLGDCVGSCASSLMAEVTGCGDPSQSSSNDCYCGVQQTQVINLDPTSLTTCMLDCPDFDLSIFQNTNQLVQQMQSDILDLCGGLGAPSSFYPSTIPGSPSTTTGSPSTQTNTGPGSSTDTGSPVSGSGGSTDTGTIPGSTSSAGAASPTSLSKAAVLAAGGLGFLAFAL